MYRLFLLFLFSLTLCAQLKNTSLTGKVYDSSSKLALPGCNIYIDSLNIGTVSGPDGNYNITIPSGIFTVKFSYVGFKIHEEKINTEKSGTTIKVDVYLDPVSYIEDEVTVTAKKEFASTTVQRIDKVEIQKMPRLYNDVLRTVKILPGVTSNNELSSGYNVRGGNFNENLIYLNGYEIYRPFLLQKGVEENQSLVNPDLTQSYSFFNGTFPARLGDKMSSAIEIDYTNNSLKKYTTTFRADLLNAGLSNSGNIGKLKWSAGVRYSYPFLLQKQLQTSGVYRPEFKDIQVLLSYPVGLNSEVEFFGILADNRYKLTPNEWVGHFRSDRGGVVNAVTFDFEGDNSYTYKTKLAGLKYIYNPDSTINLTFSTSYYSTREDEYKNQSADIFYSPDAEEPEFGKEYLKTRFEKANDYLSFERVEGSFDFSKMYNEHVVRGGAKLDIINYADKRNEYTYEEGDELLYDEPLILNSYKEYDLNSISAYLEDEIHLHSSLYATLGVRLSRYDYNDETLLSPRANIVYTLSPIHKFSFSWGYYYQSPFFYELRNKDPKDDNKLLSQRAIHYMLGWEYQFKEKVKFQAELYYKDLSRLIPFYVEQMKLEYLTENNSEGYAFGFDALVQGELDPGMQSWIGYSYLDTRERKIGETEWKRRILDQTHTIQIYIQDRIDKHPNWQSHLRLLFGSGYLFYHRTTMYDENNVPYIGIDYNEREEYLFYMRADMGLSATFPLGEGKQIMIMAEVMNVFNNYNFAGYEWVQAFKDYNHPIRIPQIFSKRFYNIRVELEM